MTKVFAYVLVRTEPGTSHQIVSLRTMPGVVLAHSVFGRFDAVLVVSANSLEELSTKVYEIVSKQPSVVKVETLVCLPTPSEKAPKKKEEIKLVTSFHCPSCHALNEVEAATCFFCGYKFK
ncbi:MAG: Lrp/AsnC ligand binding domain-containing protein [Candidatus Caldarchaeum sp.]|nr:Lrp/AsnC ligand binding domain-containing protein [Candidatus Caldarchaeum sp.]MCX8200523.1 Lrp/AsnC ligand binding domain-containing protein [Candidatus Caldarchaeum sp.]MDW8436015.1 Lrp/AsnC ligand binding domain-containing protein [Candidatus Caldarchaeum sp.]